MEDDSDPVVTAIITAQAAGTAAIAMVQELTFMVAKDQPDSAAWMQHLAARVSARFDARSKEGETKLIAIARQVAEAAYSSVTVSLRAEIPSPKADGG